MPVVKTTKNNIRRLVAIPAAALIAFSAIGASGVTPAAMAAQTAGQTSAPVSPFKLSNDWGLNQAIKNELVSQVNQSVAKNGVTITVTEISFDDAQLSIGYVEHVAEGHQKPSYFPVILNGEEMHQSSLQSSPVKINDQTTAHTLFWTNIGQFPDEFELKLQFRKLDQASSSLVPGDWELAIPVKKATKGTKVFKPMETKTYGDLTYTLKEVAVTPVQTAVKFEISYPDHLVDSGYVSSMRVVDEDGTEYEPRARDQRKFKDLKTGDSVEYVYTFSPFQELPESIKIRFNREKWPFMYEAKPEIYKAAVDRRPTAEDPIILNRSELARYKITDIRYGNDMTEVRFRSEGPDPHGVSLEIEDANGKEMAAINKRMVDPKTYTFVAEFPALDPQTKISFVTMERNELTYAPELDITLPVKP